jgi:hypothetical protein
VHTDDPHSKCAAHAVYYVYAWEDTGLSYRDGILNDTIKVGFRTLSRMVAEKFAFDRLMEGLCVRVAIDAEEDE